MRITVEQFAEMLIPIVGESAIHDSENYDGGETIDNIGKLYDKLIIFKPKY